MMTTQRYREIAAVEGTSGYLDIPLAERDEYRRLKKLAPTKASRAAVRARKAQRARLDSYAEGRDERVRAIYGSSYD